MSFPRARSLALSAAAVAVSLPATQALAFSPTTPGPTSPPATSLFPTSPPATTVFPTTPASGGASPTTPTAPEPVITIDHEIALGGSCVITGAGGQIGTAPDDQVTLTLSLPSRATEGSTIFVDAKLLQFDGAAVPATLRGVGVGSVRLHDAAVQFVYSTTLSASGTAGFAYVNGIPTDAATQPLPSSPAAPIAFGSTFRSGNFEVHTNAQRFSIRPTEAIFHLDTFQASDGSGLATPYTVDCKISDANAVLIPVFPATTPPASTTPVVFPTSPPVTSPQPTTQTPPTTVEPTTPGLTTPIPTTPKPTTPKVTTPVLTTPIATTPAGQLPAVSSVFGQGYGFIGGLVLVQGNRFDGYTGITVGGKKGITLGRIGNFVVAIAPALPPGSYPVVVTTKSGASPAATGATYRYTSIF